MSYPSSALAYAWRDKIFRKRHIIEVVDEPFVINGVVMCPGIRVETGEAGLYRAARLRPLTGNARVFLE